MAIVTIGIDLAKNVFAVHGVDATGKAVLVRPSVARAKRLELIALIPACLIDLEELPGWANTVVGDLLSEVPDWMNALPCTTATLPPWPPKAPPSCN